MEFAGISLFDLVVLAIVAIAGLIGLMTGFIRGGLFLASWIIAVIAAFLGLPAVEPFAAELVGPGLWATVAAGGGVFLVSLAVLLVISHFVTKLVRASHLNMLDRSLGLLAGGVVGVGVLAVLYVPLGLNFPIDDFPWIRDAKTRPIIQRTSVILLKLVPEELRGNFSLDEETARSSQADLDRLSSPPPLPTGGPAHTVDPGYTDATLDQLDREVENQR
ncbi:MAG: CvpA family protein [Alphaproteobacteria bacterium]|nr:CvpA family protein [Alphaproteobacteria bacterium]MCZ6764217.1 CvpA family protein [Alphaproteobacteria bacterium]